MSFNNDKEVYEALLSGETLKRTDDYQHILYKLINNNLTRSLDHGKTWVPSELKTSFNLLAIKMKTIKIGDVEVPAPVKKPLPKNKVYYIPSFSEFYIPKWWGSCSEDMKYLESGLIHLTAENAQKHASALIALSANDKENNSN